MAKTPRSPQDLMTFEAVLVEGFESTGRIVRKIRDRYTVTVSRDGCSAEHTRARAVKQLVSRHPWLSDDYSLLYLNGSPTPRYMLGQRAYKYIAGAWKLCGAPRLAAVR